MLPKGALAVGAKGQSQRNKCTATLSILVCAIAACVVGKLAILDIPRAQAINIRPDDFERLIMPCYLSAGGGGASSSSSFYANNQAQQQYPAYSAGQLPAYSSQQQQQQSSFGRSSGSSLNGNNNNNGNNGNGIGANSYQPITYFGGAGASDSSRAARDGSSVLANLGQQVPRANTVDNFIALVSKIEAANPRLASDLDQFIKVLLGRFHLDDFYYDSRTRLKVGEQTRRSIIQSSILNPGGLASQAQEAQSNFFFSSSVFPENILDHDEKCSMYFMLSHFVDRRSSPLVGQSSFAGQQPLASLPVPQLAGPLQGGQLPPNLQAAGTGYPGQSASIAFGGGGGAGGNAPSRGYPGPSTGFGSPAMANMYAFGSGVSNSKVESSGANPYGMNVVQPMSQIQQNYNNLRNSGGQYSGTSASNYRQSAPYVDGGGGATAARSRDERGLATEYGVVTVANQENAALVLNRVLMGLLAALTPAQTIRQLAGVVYGAQPLTSTPKLDDELDPLYAVTLADLWATSAIIKPGKEAIWGGGGNARDLGADGRWNDTVCPTQFFLERSHSIKFTTAELLGGLDGFSLGMLRRQLSGMRRQVRLSDLLRMYYSRDGFKRQFAEVGVCRRSSAINSQLDEIRRQSEIYLRLLELTAPKTDGDIANFIQMQNHFVEKTRQAASQQYAPADICQDSSSMDQYALGGGGFNGQMQGGEQCEIAKADVAAILDASPQANEPFMSLVVIKLAQKLGLSRLGSTLSVLTNQEDRTGFSGPNGFNAIVRNSTNTGEIGCAFVHDTSRSYSGGQISEASRLVEMFERAIEDLDSEYLVRQRNSAPTSAFASARPSSYISGLLGQFGAFSSGGGGGGGYGNTKAPRNTGGSKVIVWFNYDSFQQRPNALSSSGTNWYPQRSSGGGGSSSDQSSQERFEEAKRDLRENFRGAAILAVTTNRENSKDFVYDEEHDLFNDIPQGNGAGSSSSSFDSSSSFGAAGYQASTTLLSDPSTVSQLNGPAEQLVNRLLARICEAPAMFQYPMCFREPSNNVASVGFISPGRRQNWMMAPRTFFSSRTVRMAFKVEGGRLRVCFGRMAKPDESAAKNPDQRTSTGIVSFISAPPSQSSQQGGSGGGNGGGPSASSTASPASSSSSLWSSSGNNYYTGKEYGVCKDVAPGQEIEFVVEDPCYKDSIADCAPFYFVIKEISQGELDMNYMCRDEGCKTLDQAKFVMTHTGVESLGLSSESESVYKLLSPNNSNKQHQHQQRQPIFSQELLWSAASAATAAVALCLMSALVVQQVSAQQAGVYDYGQGRAGEKRGNFTPSEVLSMILLAMSIVAGLSLTLGLCYYLTKRTSSPSSRQGSSISKGLAAYTSGQQQKAASANEIAQAMGHPSNFEPILACTVAFIVVGILMMVTGGVICLIYFTEITPPNFDSNYHRYVGSSMPRIIGPLLVAFGGLLSVGDFIVIGLTVQQYQKKRTNHNDETNDGYQIETEAKSILSS